MSSTSSAESWWSVGRSRQHALLSSLLSPCAFTPHLRLTGPANCGKTRLVLDVLRERQCSFAFVDCLAVHSVRAALSSVHAQLSRGWEESPLPALSHSVRAAKAAPPVFRSGGSELAVVLLDAPHLQRRTAFIALKQPTVRPPRIPPSVPTTASPLPFSPYLSRFPVRLCVQALSGAVGAELVAGLLAVSEASRRHVTLLCIERESDGGGRGGDGSATDFFSRQSSVRPA